MCERKRNCASCGSQLTSKRHECLKSYCANCKRNVEVGHLCYMQPLKNRLPRNDVLYVFYDFETTQNTEVTDCAKLHAPNLVCLQQFCSECETMTDIDADCGRCGKRRHAFWEDPVGD